MASSRAHLSLLSLLLAAGACHSDDDLVTIERPGQLDLLGVDDDELLYLRSDRPGLFALSDAGETRLVIDGIRADQGIAVMARAGDALYVVANGTLWQVPAAGPPEVVAEDLGAVHTVAVDDRTVYLGNNDDIRTVTLGTARVAMLREGGGFGARGFTAIDGSLVFGEGATLRAIDPETGVEEILFEAPERPAAPDIVEEDTDVELVGAVGDQIVFLETTVAQYETDERWSNGDRKIAYRVEHATLHAMRRYDRAMVTEWMVPDAIAAAIGGDTVWAVDRAGRVMSIDPESRVASWADREIPFTAEQLDAVWDPTRLYATAGRLVYQTEPEVISGVDLP